MTTPKTAFILSKDPVLEHTGDVALARMLMQLAADSSTADMHGFGSVAAASVMA